MQAKSGNCVNNFDISTSTVKQSNALQLPDLVSRIGLSKTDVIGSKFHQKFTAKHPKGCRVTIDLQTRVFAELDRLQKGHIEKLSSCSDKNFSSPIVITVQKYQYKKLA